MLAILFIMIICGGTLVTLAAIKSPSFRIMRKTSIKAPAERIFPLINNLAQWNDWYPREKLDPSMDKNFSAETSGKGATYGWESEGDAGAGELEITDSVFPTHVEVTLEMSRPYVVKNLLEFKIEAEDGYTAVKYSIAGLRDLKARIKSIFADPDEAIVDEIEDSLENLKYIAEKKK